MTNKKLGVLILMGVSMGCFAQSSDSAKTDAAEVLVVENESATFPVMDKIRYLSGCKPKKVRFDQQWGSVVPGAMDVESIVVWQGGVKLQKDTDYIVESTYGTLAFCSSTTADVKTPVTLSYHYSLKRLDSWIRRPDGTEYLKKGISALANPQPPEIAKDEVRVENIFVDAHCRKGEGDHFPVTSDPIVTGTTKGKIPRTLKKLNRGGPVKIVFWGDSVTVGGDASTEELRFANVTQRLINEKFPAADIRYEVIAVGGSGSVHWLFPEMATHATHQDQCNFDRVINAQPDLVVIEFVNDDYLNGNGFYKQYDRILEEMKKLNAEVVFVAPHLTWPGKLGISNVRDPDPRPYTRLLKKFTADSNCALADVSSRWAQTWKQGVPYSTYLKNGINHPDDRGHAMMASEIIRCFE